MGYEGLGGVVGCRGHAQFFNFMKFCERVRMPLVPCDYVERFLQRYNFRVFS